MTAGMDCRESANGRRQLGVEMKFSTAVMTAGSLRLDAALIYTNSQPPVSRELVRFEKVIGLKPV